MLIQLIININDLNSLSDDQLIEKSREIKNVTKERKHLRRVQLIKEGLLDLYKIDKLKNFVNKYRKVIQNIKDIRIDKNIKIFFEKEMIKFKYNLGNYKIKCNEHLISFAEELIKPILNDTLLIYITRSLLYK